MERNEQFNRGSIVMILVLLCASVGALMFASAPALAASRGVVGYIGGSGIAGGLFSTPGGAAVNNTTGNVYVADDGNNRVQELSETGAFVGAWGAGVITPGAAGTGTLTDSSTRITSIVTKSGAFVAGQTITGAGILLGTTIIEVRAGQIVLSQPTTAAAAGSGISLSVAEGAGNIPVDERQTVTLGSKTTGGSFTLTFATPLPSPTTATATLAYNAPATGGGSVQEALEDLANIGPGDVAVSGPAGGPWTIEFTGTRFADTNVEQMKASGTELMVSSGPKTATVATGREGAGAFEVCREAATCVRGVASSAAGGMSTPEGVAVEQTTGDVYVTDQGNRRVDEFNGAGAFVRAFGLNVGGTGVDVCTSTCVVGASGAAAGEFGASVGYPSVDPSTGDVYVADPANMRVDVFEADGVFKRAFGWGVANGRSEFQVCTTTCQAGAASAGETNAGRFAAGSPTGVAVDGAGNIYAVDGGSPNFRVQKFGSVSADNVPLAEFFASTYLTGDSSATAPTAVAVEPSLGDVLVAREPASPAEHLVYGLSPSGGLLETYGEGAALPAPSGLAAGPGGVSVYLSTATGNRIFTLGTLVLPTVKIEAASDVTAGEATLHGTIDPEENPPNGLETTWWFEYSINGSEWTQAPASKVAATTSPVTVAQTVEGLAGDTLYYVRLRAEKEYAAGSATSATTQFTTAAAVAVVSEESVSDVMATSATLNAWIDPQHLTTSYHFEYDTTPYTAATVHGVSIPVPGEDIGAGVDPIAVSQHPQRLRPDTTYHYRVVAVNAAGVSDGPEQAFTTETQGEKLAMLDGRMWELVSPPDTGGAQVDALEEEGGVAQAAADGGAFTWASSVPIGTKVAGNRTPEWSQIYSARTAGGWSSRDIAGPHEAVFGLVEGDRSEYKFFSASLSLGLVEAKGKTLLSPQATEKTPYIREDAGESYLPLVTAANVPAGVKFGGHQEEDGVEIGSPEFLGTTPDLSHVVLSQNGEGLTPNAPSGGGIYEWSRGRLQLVDVLPEGSVATKDPEFPQFHDMHAISDDGSRVIWSTETNRGASRSGADLYMRDMTKGESRGEIGETIQLDVPEAGVTEPGNAESVFQAASNDGHRVFFTDAQRLTADSSASTREPDLYEFETTNAEGEPLKGVPTDLTDANAGESADVQGLLGTSEDGSYVYLVAKGILSEAANAEHEKAASGADNLYVLHDLGARWTTTFIARLSGEDQHDWEYDLSDLTSGVSPDGRWLAFMSDRELTGYDNHDVNSGVPDEEVFLYDAEAGATGRLVCASCNPTDARPAGVRDEVLNRPLFDEAELWPQRWLAANIPGWTPVDLNGEAYHQSRYLSNSGRLFFDSSDALVQQDQDGTEDVYEYEPPEVGSCTTSQATFVGRAEGCVNLISSGTSSAESVFLDASEGGGEVFFVTSARLVTQDIATSEAVYDARECTAQSPCATPLAETPPPCTTPEACRTPSAPQPAIFGAPPSQTFSGVGDFAPGRMTITKAKAKPLTRAQKLAKALKACKRKPRRRRSACEAQARRKYGAAKVTKISKGKR
jgi:DNA-binding beta-propeller fold protein YncE